MYMHLSLDILYPITREVLRLKEPKDYIETLKQTLNNTPLEQEQKSHITQDLITMLGYADQETVMYTDESETQNRELIQTDTINTCCLTFPYYTLLYDSVRNEFKFYLSLNDSYKYSQVNYASEYPLKMFYSSWKTINVYFKETDQYAMFQSVDTIYACTKKYQYNLLKRISIKSTKKCVFLWFDSKRLTFFLKDKRAFDIPYYSSVLNAMRDYITNKYKEFEGLRYVRNHVFFRYWRYPQWLEIARSSFDLPSSASRESKHILYKYRKYGLEAARLAFFGTKNEDIQKLLAQNDSPAIAPLKEILRVYGDSEAYPVEDLYDRLITNHALLASLDQILYLRKEVILEALKLSKEEQRMLSILQRGSAIFDLSTMIPQLLSNFTLKELLIVEQKAKLLEVLDSSNRLVKLYFYLKYQHPTDLGNPWKNIAFLQGLSNEEPDIMTKILPNLREKL